MAKLEEKLQSRLFELETAESVCQMELLFDEAKILRDEAKELRDEVKGIRDEISRKRRTGGVDGIDDDDEEAQKSKRLRFDISEHDNGISIVFG